MISMNFEGLNNLMFVHKYQTAIILEQKNVLIYLRGYWYTWTIYILRLMNLKKLTHFLKKNIKINLLNKYFNNLYKITQINTKKSTVSESKHAQIIKILASISSYLNKQNTKELIKRYFELFKLYVYRNKSIHTNKPILQTDKPIQQTDRLNNWLIWKNKLNKALIQKQYNKSKKVLVHNYYYKIYIFALRENMAKDNILNRENNNKFKTIKSNLIKSIRLTVNRATKKIILYYFNKLKLFYENKKTYNKKWCQNNATSLKICFIKLKEYKKQGMPNLEIHQALLCTYKLMKFDKTLINQYYMKLYHYTATKVIKSQYINKLSRICCNQIETECIRSVFHMWKDTFTSYSSNIENSLNYTKLDAYKEKVKVYFNVWISFTFLKRNKHSLSCITSHDIYNHRITFLFKCYIKFISHLLTCLIKRLYKSVSDNELKFQLNSNFYTITETYNIFHRVELIIDKYIKSNTSSNRNELQLFSNTQFLNLKRDLFVANSEIAFLESLRLVQLYMKDY